MKNPLRRGSKKEEQEDEEYQKQSASIQQSSPNSINQRDFAYTIGQSAYMIKHPEVDSMFESDETLAPMTPAFSHLNRVTRIGKLEATLAELDYEELIYIVKMNMTEDEYESKGWLTLKSLLMLSRSIIHDSFGGFKADIITNQMTTIRTQLDKIKKKRAVF